MTNETESTELDWWQARCDELHTANERLREERDAARTTAALMEAALSEAEQKMRELTALADRLRLHIQQGVEL